MKTYRKAFSYIEAILVVVILGLVASVFIPASAKIRQIARENAIRENVSEIIRAGQRYNAEKTTKSVDYKALVVSKYLEPRQSVAGETYDKIVVDSGGGKVVIESPLGEKIEKDY